MVICDDHIYSIINENQSWLKSFIAKNVPRFPFSSVPLLINHICINRKHQWEVIERLVNPNHFLALLDNVKEAFHEGE